MRDYVATGLADNAGNATTADLLAHAANVSGIPWPTATDPGLDANGTGNKRILNVYLNNGLAGWNPTDTNSYVSLTNIPYARYDVIVYCSSDASGRNATMSKLFRNVPCITHERMSPGLIVSRCWVSPAGPAGRREAGA
jgi:hypothetical protein